MQHNIINSVRSSNVALFFIYSFYQNPPNFVLYTFLEIVGNEILVLVGVLHMFRMWDYVKGITKLSKERHWKKRSVAVLFPILYMVVVLIVLFCTGVSLNPTLGRLIFEMVSGIFMLIISVIWVILSSTIYNKLSNQLILEGSSSEDVLFMAKFEILSSVISTAAAISLIIYACVTLKSNYWAYFYATLFLRIVEILFFVFYLIGHAYIADWYNGSLAGNRTIKKAQKKKKL